MPNEPSNFHGCGQITIKNVGTMILSVHAQSSEATSGSKDVGQSVAVGYIGYKKLSDESLALTANDFSDNVTRLVMATSAGIANAENNTTVTGISVTKPVQYPWQITFEFKDKQNLTYQAKVWLKKDSDTAPNPNLIFDTTAPHTVGWELKDITPALTII